MTDLRKYQYRRFAFTLSILMVLAALMFFGVFCESNILFSNDGPYGSLHSDARKGNAAIVGGWNDLNSLGEGSSGTLSLSNALFWALGPLGFAKFYAPIACVFFGICAWCCFVQLGLHPTACTLGAIAAMLNSLYFSIACWGVASQCIAAGLFFLFMGLVHDTRSTNRTWARVALAGCMLGYAVADGSDVGVIWAIFGAMWLSYQGAAIMKGNAWERFGKTVARLSVVIVMSLFSAWSAVSNLWRFVK